MADWVATVSLGLLVDRQGNFGRSDNSNKESGDLTLMAFWAPFLLLHLGGPDTITAYALADNELWLRHLLGLLVQTAAALYVTLLAWEGTLLSFLTIPMLVCGIIKYGERTWVLMSANREQFRDSVLSDRDPGPSYANFMEEFFLKETEGYYVTAAQVEEGHSPGDDVENAVGTSSIDVLDARRILHIADYFFETLKFKRLFVDLILGFHPRDESQAFFEKQECNTAFEVIEVELGFAYDVLYTKAPIIYTPFGLFFRLMTSIITLTVLLTFVASIGITSHNHLFFDIMVTYILLIGAILLEVYAARSLLLSDWANLWFNQHSSKTLSFLRLVSSLQTELKSFIFKHFREKSTDTELDLKILFTCRGAVSLHTHKSYGTFKWTVDVEFDHSILIWHIATGLCYNMLYILVMCPFMLPIGIGIIRFRDTCAEALLFFEERSSGTKLEGYEMLGQVSTKVFPSTVKGDRSKSVLFEACKLAASLKEMGDPGKMWKMVGDVWVEILGYAASQCRGFDHAQQLEKGGELLTHVWFLMAHLGITEHFKIIEGHGRVKLAVT